jgi:hypothetical protein
MADGFEHAFAEVAGFITVTKFDGLVFSSRGAGRDGGAAYYPAFQTYFSFDCGIAA